MQAHLQQQQSWDPRYLPQDHLKFCSKQLKDYKNDKQAQNIKKKSEFDID